MYKMKLWITGFFYKNYETLLDKDGEINCFYLEKDRKVSIPSSELESKSSRSIYLATWLSNDQIQQSMECI